MNPIIAALKKMIESERDDEMTAYELCTGPVGYRNGHEAATERFLPLIEKAVVMASYYADKKNWGEPTTDIRDWYLIESTDRGKKAREFLAEIEKEIGDE